MEIRQALLEEIPEIMNIYEQAKVFMKAHENPTQWKDGYPSVELVTEDCKNKELYVCVEKGKIVGVFMFTERPDKTYREIFQGEWLNEKPYGTMHRMASSGIQKGVSSFCLDWCFKQCGNVKGDTHEDNYVMQKVFEKNGFRRCGIIYVEDGTPRIAYQREN